MTRAPAPTVVTRTFLFWDLEGSTALWENDADAAASTVAAWEGLAQQCVADADGELFKLTGDGGCAAFESAASAVNAAIRMQRDIGLTRLAARMALMSGEAQRRDGDWYGAVLNRCARLMALGHGGQVLLAGSTASLLAAGTVELADLGAHVLRDVADAVVVYQLNAEGLRAEFPPLRSDVRTVSLPNPRSHLVGRAEELDELSEFLADNRLVTLTGVGGSGKTRLAIAAAERVSSRFPITTFVDLASIAHPGLVAACAAGALGIVTSGRDVDADLVADFLERRDALLVIDNAEHLLDSTADLVEAVLDRAPGVRVLVTSREPLGVTGERIVRVPSLDSAGAGLELFLDRAGVDVDPVAAESVCRRLDGIPLAIELAAARARTLGVQEVLRSLDQDLAVLTGGRRATGRQATLQAALDWSYQLLGDEERRVFRRLSVFAGGFTVAAADQVCNPNGPALRDLIAGLVDKSLVVLHDGRHSLLETVRMYAQGQLALAGELAEIRDRHAQYWLNRITNEPFAGTTELLRGGYVAESANLRAATDWLSSQNRYRDALVVVSRSAGVWHYLMQDFEIAPLLTELIERSQSDLTACEKAMAYAVLVALDPPRAREWSQASVDADPEHACPEARGGAVNHASFEALDDPHAALERLRRLRSLPGGLGVESRLLSIVVEARALDELGDHDGADRALRSVLTDRSSLFASAVLGVLALRRAVEADGESAKEILAIAKAAEGAGLRTDDLIHTTARSCAHVADDDFAAAAADVRLLETMRDERFALHPSGDHFWYIAAAYLAAGLGDLRAAARLWLGCNYASHSEVQRYPILVLAQRHGSDSGWMEELNGETTMDQVTATARAIGRRA